MRPLPPCGSSWEALGCPVSLPDQSAPPVSYSLPFRRGRALGRAPARSPCAICRDQVLPQDPAQEELQGESWSLRANDGRRLLSERPSLPRQSQVSSSSKERKVTKVLLSAPHFDHGGPTLCLAGCGSPGRRYHHWSPRGLETHAPQTAGVCSLLEDKVRQQ